MNGDLQNHLAHHDHVRRAGGRHHALVLERQTHPSIPHTHNQNHDQLLSAGGRHHALVLERLGDSLEEVMAKYGGSLMPRGPGGSAPGLPMPVVRKVVRRLLLALDQLHRWVAGCMLTWVLAPYK